MHLMLGLLLHLPVVLMYHRVDVWAPDDPVSRSLTISPSQFRRELECLRQHGLRGVSVERAYALVRSQRSLSTIVILTFDDGYSDQYRYAYPLLKRFGDSATFFITAANVGIPRHLSWRQIRIMIAGGMSIGGHSLDHIDLSALDPAEQRHQIGTDLRDIVRYAHVIPLSFAYPGGTFDRATVRALRSLGILFGFTTDPRNARPLDRRYAIPRERVLDDTTIAGFEGLLQSMRLSIGAPYPQTHAFAR
jgi:peptidoglycan/xylan/chitin deacetylase (PgdA/CDA1 family)